MISRLTSFINRRVNELSATQSTNDLQNSIKNAEQTIAKRAHRIDSAYRKGEAKYLSQQIKEVNDRIDIEHELLEMKQREAQEKQQILAALDTATGRLRQLQQELNKTFKS